MAFTDEMDPTRFRNFVPWNGGRKAAGKAKAKARAANKANPANLEKERGKVRKLRTLAAPTTFPEEKAVATARANDLQARSIGLWSSVSANASRMGHLPEG